MGGYLSFIRSVKDEDFGTRGRKRGSDDSGDEDQAMSEVDSVLTPKRKKMKTTSSYIYQTLFVNGNNSDVSIIALGKEWRLHKVYLCQCGYFMSMFRGSWKESTQSVINMSIPDKNIDEEALGVAFGSLYRDDVTVKPAHVVGVLAAAALLQHDGLEQQAAEIMMETVCASTVCSYLTAARLYGQANVARKCFGWLEINLMLNCSASLLRSIGIDLMEQLVLSSDLVVMQVEMDIYTMLKKWLYLQLTPSWQGQTKQLATDAESFYKGRSKPINDDHNTSIDCDLSQSYLAAAFFLATPEGEPYARVFRCLRFQHIINDTASVKVVLADKLIPEEWLLPYFKCQWLHMLQIEQGKDKGPQDVSAEAFNQESFRCGRVLPKDGEYCWRWTGFHYGVDFLVTYSNKLVIFKRNTTNQSPNSVSMQPRRSFFYRLSAFSLDALGNVCQCKHSGMKSLSLGKDEELVAMCLDRNITFPLHISLCLLSYTPDPVLRAETASKGCPSAVQSPLVCDSQGHANVGDAATVPTAEVYPVNLRNDSAVMLLEQNVVVVDLT